MHISTKCSIALHCLVFIAEYGEKRKVTSELLAKSTGCNAVVIRNTLGALQKAGILSVVRGKGGAHLSCAPETLSVWDVYAALDPKQLECLIGMHTNPSPNCPVGVQIGAILEKPYRQIRDAVRAEMQQITLAQLLESYRPPDIELP